MPAPFPSDPAAQLRSMQVVHGALMAGVAVFVGVAVAAGPVGAPLPAVVAGLDPVALAATVASVTCAALSFVLPGRLLDAVPARDVERRVGAYRTGRLLAAALCEAPALLWGVDVLLSGNRWHLGGLAGLLVLMALHAPTRASFRDATGLRLGEG
jgi:hypothetical protein